MNKYVKNNTKITQVHTLALASLIHTPLDMSYSLALDLHSAFNHCLKQQTVSAV